MVRRIFLSTILSIIFAAGFVAMARQAAPQNPAAQPAAPPSTHLKVGNAAPDFTLTDHNGKQVKLSELKGKKNAVLAFYIKASTGG